MEAMAYELLSSVAGFHFPSGGTMIRAGGTAIETPVGGFAKCLNQVEGEMVSFFRELVELGKAGLLMKAPVLGVPDGIDGFEPRAKG